MTDHDESDFKLLAIRPMLGCGSKYLKNLSPGTVYSFYRSVRYLNKLGKPALGKDEINSVILRKPFDGGIYDLKRNHAGPLKINLTAIVGKNGTGKSTLMDILFASTFIISDELGLLSPNEADIIPMIEGYKNRLAVLKTRINQNFSSEKILQAFSEASNNFQNLSEFFSNLSAEFEEKKKDIVELTKTIEDSQRTCDDFREVKQNLRAEIYYAKGSEIFKLEIGNSGPPEIAALNTIRTKGKNTAWSKVTNKNLLERFDDLFFYSIAVNYSHYSLNSLITGEWLNALFHKNDGYKTPVVINPMRIDGNFDINAENEFAKYRLLINALIQITRTSEVKYLITDKQYISRVHFTLKPRSGVKNRITSLDNQSSGIAVYERLLNVYLNRNYADFLYAELLQLQFPFKTQLANYIVNKIEKIAGQYPGFEQYSIYVQNGDEESLNLLVSALVDDKTHITYKLKQATNFFRHLMRSKSDFFASKVVSTIKSAPDLSFTLTELLGWIGNPKPEDVVVNIPPSIFSIDFEISDDQKAVCLFNALSSGEQQMIHSIHCVIYHLNNIQSVHSGKPAQRLAYRSVNIIFDEIELYFHPGYQREFISRFLNELTNFYNKGSNSVNSINVVFLTHSPFILSDLIKENILLLESGKNGKSSPKTSKSKTFAAEINDLLADSFFLDETFMGTFAQQKIISAMKDSGKASQTKRKALSKIIGDTFIVHHIND